MPVKGPFFKWTHYGLWLLLILASCANPLSPTGGPRDEAPPELVAEGSTPAGQTRFRPREIALAFNEWVKIQDAYRQIVVSPPLQYRYEVKLRKKTVILAFDEREQLRDSATYVVNFGSAIRDLTEGNAAENLQFVFSTGDQIDSFSVSGRLVDAYTGKPIDGALFLLYENAADSVVRTERPFYFGRANKNGQFKVSNLKGGRFKAAALVDADLNYLYNQPTEAFGFLDTLIAIDENTARDSLLLRLSVKPLPFRRVGVDTASYGRVKVAFNQRADLVSRAADSLAYPLAVQTDKDTLLLWSAARSPWQLTLSADSAYLDTLSIQPRSGQPAPLKAAPAPKALRLNPGLPLTVAFNQPIRAFDTSRMSLLVDTLRLPARFSVGADTLRPRQALVSAAWQENKPYALQWLPGAVTDWFGQTNADTVSYTFTIDARKNYGNLILRFTGYPPQQQYLVRVLEKSGREAAVLTLYGQAYYEFALNSLASGIYVLETIYDENRNGRWDAGDYDLKRQPERVSIRELDPLRPNWDLELDIPFEPEE